MQGVGQGEGGAGGRTWYASKLSKLTRERAMVYSTWLTMSSWMDSTSFFMYVSAIIGKGGAQVRHGGGSCNDSSPVGLPLVWQ